MKNDPENDPELEAYYTKLRDTLRGLGNTVSELKDTHEARKVSVELSNARRKAGIPDDE